MAKSRKTISTKNSLNLFVLGVLALIIVIGIFALQQSNGFSLLSRASTLSSGSTSTTSPYMCQVECATDIQCGKNQICATKPGSISKQKFCYNPSCPDNKLCGGEGCGGECRAVDVNPTNNNDAYFYPTENDCLTRCTNDYPGRVCRHNYFFDGGRYACVSNLCSFNGMNVSQSDPSHQDWAHETLVIKNNTCPARNFSSCGEGYTCERWANGIKITKVKDIGTASALGEVGRNCVCTNNRKSGNGVYEYTDLAFCEDVYHSWTADTMKKGDSYTCTFDPMQCVRN